MKWPWVSRRAYEFMELTLERVQKERDDFRDEAARAKDELINRMGFSPVSAPVRSEIKEANAEVEKYLASSQFEDVSQGMLSEEVLELANDLGEKTN
jgi:hypothetical protein